MRKILLLLLLQIATLNLFATDFVVTSNADSGPGTLRQALLDAAANGSATQDRIIFNIADVSEAGRTINLNNQLPDVSSNLIIDGTSQPGATFKLTDAKIKISTPVNNIAIIVFNGTNLTSVAFYGLYIFDYSDFLTSRPDLKPRKGFNLTKSTYITIGAINKGNRINGFNVSSIDIEESDQVKIKNNVISISDDVGTFNSNNGSGGFASGYGGSIDLIKSDNIELGGDPGEGNIIFTIVNFKFYQLTRSKVSVKSNNFLVYPNGLNTEWYFEYYNGTVFFSTIFSADTKNTEESIAKEAVVDMDMSNNVTGSQINIFIFNFINGTINLTHNFLNVARDGVTPIKYLTQIPPSQGPFIIQNCSAQFNFGTNNINDKNFFYNVGGAVGATNSPNIFLRYNEFSCVGNVAYVNYTGPAFPEGGYQLPVITINGISVNGGQTQVTGKATPQSVVDIYSSENCQSKCSIHSYIKTASADAAGNWQTTIDNLSGIFYASATLNHQTSLFKTFEVNKDNINIQPMRCSNTATITGLKVPQGLSYYWTDYNGNIVSHDLDLTTTKTGDYRLVLGEGCITSDWFKIEDKRLSIYDGFSTRTLPGCGTTTGSVKGLFVFDPLSKLESVIWTDAVGKDIGHTADINGLAPGVYTLTVKSTDGCSTTYILNLSNTTGPNIDQSNPTITPNPCGQSSGSITGITATGTGILKYSWKNAQNVQVATTKDLTNQPGGKYTLQVTDDTNCGPVYTSAIEIPEVNGITMDASQAIITPAACDANGGGSVKGINVTGATKYQWLNDANVTVGTGLDLINVVPGNYHLVASNTTCSKQTAIFTIVKHINNKTYRFTNSATTYATCDMDNGHIEVVMNPAYDIPVTYRWINLQGTTVGTTPNMKNLPVNTYTLYGADDFGCEKLILTTNLIRVPALNFNQNQMIINPDQCGLGKGSIHGLRISGGHPPYTLSWKNSSGKVIGNSADIDNLPTDTYSLTVTDLSDCGLLVGQYTIGDNQAALPVPTVSDLQLCSAGDALLVVNNPTQGRGYRLYNDANSASPIADETSGKFKINVKVATSYYVSQYTGNCESGRTEVKVILGGLSGISLPNTFSPNGDGINDSWNIPGIESYPNANIQLYTRSGQKVYESTGYSTPFDGNFQGKSLPMGTYYYIINLNSGCGLLSGSVTIIR
ncbi:gliding motility-associated C-terminal domain-containing protein [Mucilaginibacter boryungensis]|uniref:Gliding motility-associated C-terminal domain-containing protein n=1 Tax=Mucilaginibacter boryungensis TaxID=768480 RepID=A0ABR9XM46_9SPHI|nr:gliding motility-associated C-terminal domain-containing protein [Mucilaginibacter boryungensis]MBE9668457.1 gliding motility-associated C-terminal domain-containing protein [Mucilaginibacter boryungensis]